uniref:Uncharacterized protein n=1 Tax=Anguilla anguilla TaxID=7936 RepID=A0A0E9T719_ANGAN
MWGLSVALSSCLGLLSSTCTAGE